MPGIFKSTINKVKVEVKMCIRDRSIPLGIEDYIEELNTITVIAFNNGYNEKIIDNIFKKQKKKKSNAIKNKDINNRNENLETKARKYIAAPYTHFMPGIFKSTINKVNNIVVSYKTSNNRCV